MARRNKKNELYGDYQTEKVMSIPNLEIFPPQYYIVRLLSPARLLATCSVSGVFQMAIVTTAVTADPQNCSESLGRAS